MLSDSPSAKRVLKLYCSIEFLNYGGYFINYQKHLRIECLRSPSSESAYSYFTTNSDEFGYLISPKKKKNQKNGQGLASGR